MIFYVTKAMFKKLLFILLSFVVIMYFLGVAIAYFRSDGVYKFQGEEKKIALHAVDEIQDFYDSDNNWISAMGPTTIESRPLMK